MKQFLLSSAISIFIFFGVHSYLNGQVENAGSDGFNTTWDLYESNNNECQLEDHKIDLRSSDGRGISRLIYHPMTSPDFELNLVIDTLKKRGDAPIKGLLFDFTDWSNYGFFYLEELTYTIGYVSSGRLRRVANHVHIKTILEKENNSLKIKGSRDKYVFYINEHHVQTVRHLGEKGPFIGMVIGGEGNARFNAMTLNHGDSLSSKAKDLFEKDCMNLIPDISSVLRDSLDKKYTPPLYSEFFKEKNSYSSSVGLGNGLKWNVTTMARGNFAFEYERHLTRGITMMLSGGVLLYPDFLYWNGFNASDSGTSGADLTKDKPGYFLGAEFKYYFIEDVFNNTFIGAGFRRFEYNNKFGLVGLSAVINNTSFTENLTDYYVTFGRSSMYTDNIFGEFSISTGLKHIQSYNLASTTIINPITGDSELDAKLVPDNRLGFTIFFSYKIGFAF